MATPYRYTRPVPKHEATGLVAATYAQIAEDFILIDGPLMSLSPAPEVLAATWALLREAQLAGTAARLNKEAVGAAASSLNDCHFCIDAHISLVHASGAHALAEALWRGQEPDDPEQRRLVAWAYASLTPGADALMSFPFPASQAPEYIGTVLMTHFLNRVVQSLLNDRLLPGRLRESSLVRRAAGQALTRVMQRSPRPGESLALLPLEFSDPLPSWAQASPVGPAWLALRAAGRGGGLLLDDCAREFVLGVVAGWQGTRPGVSGASLEPLLGTVAPAERPGARLAVLAALAPHAITDADVAAWRAGHPADADLVRLIAFGAVAAVERIEAWLAPNVGEASVSASLLAAAG